MLSPLAILATVFDRLGHNETATIVSGFADTPFTRASFPEMTVLVTHLREVLGEDAYESLAHTGATKTAAALVPYAFEQIDRARAELPR